MNDGNFTLLLPVKKSDWAEANALPDDLDNIFQRLIRNPHIESDTPRERECTEMVCAVLRNTTQLRLHLFRWLAAEAKIPVDAIDSLDFVIDTEQPIGPKRDDLRIVGWLPNGEGAALLWTIEVKVGAGFHDSTPHTSHDLEETEVNQLVNYDHWLSRQSAEHRSGFVLAIEDMRTELPLGLTCPWQCLTWAELGLQVRASLADGALPADEALLARHLLGFIRKYLWSHKEMADEQIDFDDVAMLRAFARIGFDAEKKVNRLTSQLVTLLEGSGVGTGKVIHQKLLYQGTLRSGAYRQLLDRNIANYPGFFMGVNEECLAIWLETPPGNEKKERTIKALECVRPKLGIPGWRVWSYDQKVWKDLELRMPMSVLLHVPDQNAAFMEFFSVALEDLKQAGVAEALEQALRG